jgi:Zinc-binding dehydrogenase
VINYVETPDWDEKARELTDGRGVDCVVEIGGPGTIAMSLNALAVGGHVGLIGASLSTPDWDEKARELTDGRGVDCVVEIGGPETIAMSLNALAVGGHVGLIGASLSPSGTGLDPLLLTGRGITLGSISVGSRADFEAMNRRRFCFFCLQSCLSRAFDVPRRRAFHRPLQRLNPTAMHKFWTEQECPDGMPGQLLDVAQVCSFLVAAQQHCCTGRTGARRWANTMNIVFGHVRQLEVDDVRHTLPGQSRARRCRWRREPGCGLRGDAPRGRKGRAIDGATERFVEDPGTAP